MTTPTTQGATMTLPPCPIAGHDNPHHWHGKWTGRVLTHDRHSTKDCGTSIGTFSRCYSAHVPEPSPDPDEWVRVPVGTRIPAGTLLREEWPSVGFTANEDATVQIRRSDLDVILKPAPTPAEKLAEALDRFTDDGFHAITAAEVLAALSNVGLELVKRGER